MDSETQELMAKTREGLKEINVTGNYPSSGLAQALLLFDQRLSHLEQQALILPEEQPLAEALAESQQPQSSESVAPSGSQEKSPITESPITDEQWAAVESTTAGIDLSQRLLGALPSDISFHVARCSRCRVRLAVSLSQCEMHARVVQEAPFTSTFQKPESSQSVEVTEPAQSQSAASSEKAEYWPSTRDEG